MPFCFDIFGTTGTTQTIIKHILYICIYAYNFYSIYCRNNAPPQTSPHFNLGRESHLHFSCAYFSCVRACLTHTSTAHHARLSPRIFRVYTKYICTYIVCTCIHNKYKYVMCVQTHTHKLNIWGVWCEERKRLRVLLNVRCPQCHTHNVFSSAGGGGGGFGVLIV